MRSGYDPFLLHTAASDRLLRYVGIGVRPAAILSLSLLRLCTLTSVYACREERKTHRKGGITFKTCYPPISFNPLPFCELTSVFSDGGTVKSFFGQGCSGYSLLVGKLFPETFGKQGDDLVKVAYDAQVGNVEDRSVFIAVDSHDILRLLHSCKVLNRTGDSHSEI